jgi:hypothetical protein
LLLINFDTPTASTIPILLHLTFFCGSFSHPPPSPSLLPVLALTLPSPTSPFHCPPPYHFIHPYSHVSFNHISRLIKRFALTLLLLQNTAAISSTVGVDMGSFNLANGNISVWDFAGQMEYTATHAFFISTEVFNSVIFVVFSFFSFSSFCIV